ncbi:MAG: virulence factor, partial [Pseudomonadota bacterium]|nr:virulence factor [Pseudomonadota bacterium]
RERGKYLLEHRFQAAIDRAAMRAGKGGSDAYLEEWRRITTSIESDLSPQELAEQIGRILEAEVSDEALKAMVANKGFKDAN